MSRKRRSALAMLAAVCMPVVLFGCPKKTNPVQDAAPAPTPTPTMTEAVLAPIEDDAGDAAEEEAAAKPVYHGSGLTTNQLRIKQCCNALRSQAKTMGNSPEAMQITQAATLCDGVVLAVGNQKGGQAPEFAPVRQMLTGKTIPAVCKGL